MKAIKIKLNAFSDRESMIKILALNGFKVWTAEDMIGMYDINYYVCFEPTKEDQVLEIIEPTKM